MLAYLVRADDTSDQSLSSEYGALMRNANGTAHPHSRVMPSLSVGDDLARGPRRHQHVARDGRRLRGEAGDV